MGTWKLTPGRVTIEVLDPVDTSGWSLETVEAHVTEVRDIFVDRLEKQSFS